MFKATLDPGTRLNFLKSKNVLVEENNVILFKKIVSFCSSCNILHLILFFLSKSLPKHEFYNSPGPKSEQDPRLNQFFVFRCDVIIETFPVELLIL